MAGVKVLCKLGVAPAADTGGGVCGDVVRVPTGGNGSPEFAAIVESLGQIARRMTIAAVLQGFRQVGSTVSIGAAALDCLKASIGIVKG